VRRFSDQTSLLATPLTGSILGDATPNNQRCRRPLRVLYRVFAQMNMRTGLWQVLASARPGRADMGLSS